MSRPRLTALLEGDVPLTVLRGPCGSGKTVAVAEWARGRDEPVVWITVDHDTTTSAALARAVMRGLRRREIVSKSEDDSDLTGRETWAAVEEVFHTVSEQLVIVLDDAASLRRDAAVDLCRTVANTDRVRVVAAINRRTFLDSDALDLMIDRAVIGPEELKFDADEAARALDVDEDAAASVLEETGGIAAVIHAIAKRGQPQTGQPILETAADAVQDYILVRLERAQYDPRVLRALVRASIADPLDDELARALSGDPDVADVLDEAESFGFGDWSPDRDLFTFEPLARILLRRELIRSHRDDLPKLRQLAMEWSLRRNDPFSALRLAAENDDLAAASRVIMSGWHRLLEHHGRAVIDLLGNIPLSRLRDEPLVVMLLAICYLASRLRRLRGLQLLRVAISAANSPRTPLSATERLYIWTAESAALRLVGMSERAGQVATKALKLFTDLPESAWEDYASEMPLVCTQLGISMYYADLQRQATDTFAYAAALAAAHDDRHALHSVSMLSGIHALNGDMPEALHYVELIRQRTWDDDALDGYRGTFYRIAEALLALEDCAPDRALGHVEKFEKHRATSEHWATMAAVEALVALHAQRPVAGMVQLDATVRSRGREAHSPHVRHLLSAVRSQLHLALGDSAAAAAVLQRDGSAASYETAVERARISLVEGRPAEAIRMLGLSSLSPGTSRVSLEAAAIECAAALRTAGVSAVNRDAEVLGNRLKERRLRTPLVLLPRTDADALAELLSDVDPALAHCGSVFPEASLLPALTSRERIVLRSLASGAPLADIAADLRVSQNTVKTQLRSIYRKLGVADRTQAVALAMKANLIPREQQR